MNPFLFQVQKILLTVLTAVKINVFQFIADAEFISKSPTDSIGLMLRYVLTGVPVALAHLPAEKRIVSALAIRL